MSNKAAGIYEMNIPVHTTNSNDDKVQGRIQHFVKERGPQYQNPLSGWGIVYHILNLDFKRGDVRIPWNPSGSPYELVQLVTTHTHHTLPQIASKCTLSYLHHSPPGFKTA